MAVRTYPIRVGDVDGYSAGEWYSDQHETNWDNIGVEPEITTVTQRVRRVASFSMQQFYDACHANNPDVVFISHMDYLSGEERADLLESLHDAKSSMNGYFGFLLGFGPKVSDIKTEEEAWQLIS